MPFVRAKRLKNNTTVNACVHQVVGVSTSTYFQQTYGAVIERASVASKPSWHTSSRSKQQTNTLKNATVFLPSHQPSHQPCQQPRLPFDLQEHRPTKTHIITIIYLPSISTGYISERHAHEKKQEKPQRKTASFEQTPRRHNLIRSTCFTLRWYHMVWLPFSQLGPTST